jgi:Uma2 family endonuclease
MATVLNRPERQVNLRVSWETYERLLAEHEGNSGIRFTYNQGELEILVPSVEHETLTSNIEALIELFADEMELDFIRTRSTTFRREDLEKGFEPESSFYFRNAGRVRGKKRLNLKKDPPPELVIEVDITSESMNKFPIYSGIGVPEVWHYSGDVLSIFALEGDEYVQRTQSAIFPQVAASALTGFIRSSLELKRPLWIKRIREWVRELLRSEFFLLVVQAAECFDILTRKPGKLRDIGARLEPASISHEIGDEVSAICE